MPRILLIALDSVGIDPLGHRRPESVYSESRFLFPRDHSGDPLPITKAPFPGVLVETDVVGNCERGAIECAITYTSIFSGQSAVEHHGLMRGLGLNEGILRDLVATNNLFRYFQTACLANAIFPAHLPFFGGSYIGDRFPSRERQEIEDGLHFRGKPVRLRGSEKNGFAELFTLAEINQNIFVYAANRARVRIRTWNDIRAGEALSSSMTNELEGEFNVEFFGQDRLPRRSVTEAADILVRLAKQHDFTFYKYQIPDLVSHTGKVELARAVFGVIEEFVKRVLTQLDPEEDVVVITSDHGHLEQVADSHAHPKTKVPTWFFGQRADDMVERLRRPEGIFHVLTSLNPAASVS